MKKDRRRDQRIAGVSPANLQTIFCNKKLLSCFTKKLLPIPYSLTLKSFA
ncbi:MAG: hypothetical protein LBP59_10185 [Planctomycetaceae bacterium]|nr:hypothetical protein [Planctomycetaceae bacterium]